jgi:polar amino acid transport system substrate-binding protein
MENSMKRLITMLSAAFLLALPLHATDLGGKVVQIGTDPTYPPHESIDENTKQVVGYDVDVVVEICKLVNCVPVWNPTSWEGIFPALAQGSWDMVVSGVTITDERDKIVDFSDPYIIVQQGVLMRVEDVGKVSMNTFKSGKMKLGSQTGTTNADLGIKLVGRDNVALYDAFSAAVVALQNGDVGGVIIDSTAAAAWEQEFAGELTVGINGLSSDPLGLVFQEGSELVDPFNDGLAMIKSNGTMDRLVLKWWPK